MKSAKEFILSVVYAGESSGSYVDTRVKIYNPTRQRFRGTCY